MTVESAGLRTEKLLYMVRTCGVQWNSPQKLVGTEKAEEVVGVGGRGGGTHQEQIHVRKTKLLFGLFFLLFYNTAVVKLLDYHICD